MVKDRDLNAVENLKNYGLESSRFTMFGHYSYAILGLVWIALATLVLISIAGIQWGQEKTNTKAIAYEGLTVIRKITPYIIALTIILIILFLF